MSGFFKISDAAVIALHAMMYIARHGDRMVSTREIADFHAISENHLSKVMQRLVHADYVKSIRGPKGGFELARPADGITLAELYELFEGPVGGNTCLISSPVCGGEHCIFGSLLGELNSMVTNYMNNTRLSAVLDKTPDNG